MVKGVFGFGSLVNARTHDYVDLHPAILTGWRREWVQTADRPVTFLSARPADGTLLGLIATVPDQSWQALDAREHSYQRVSLTAERLEAVALPPSVCLYKAVIEPTSAPPSPILLSYLECVLQGYLQVFGVHGVRHFIETTDGWEVPICNDLADPIYPRAQTLSAYERDLIEDHLAAYPLTIVDKAVAFPSGL